MNGKVGLIVLTVLNVTHGADKRFMVICSSPIEAQVGHDVILPCHLEPQLDVTTKTVEWSRGSMKSIVHSCRNGKDYLDDQMEQFKGRTSLCYEQLSRGNLSLKLSSVNQSDAGEYKCFVPKLEHKDNTGNVTLNVGGENKVAGIDDDTVTRSHIVVVLAVPAVLVGLAIIVGLACRRPGTTQSAQQEATSGNEEDDSHERENLTPRATPAASNLIRRQTSSE
ncbi:myelin-oligodendrocyte glycoprotein-like [Centroberyx affinis]|uniref:myelin-oligodendrocyte glycoprotein-like n=1 Tax=Centroberyx affinis TaxID=166261 RepID=UPI003A5B9807